MTFDKDYFENGLQTGRSMYENYRWIPELTIPLAHEIIQYLGIKRNQCILDYGCAKGYLVKAFRLLHYTAHGVDISSYAIQEAPADVRKHLTRIRRDDEDVSYGASVSTLPDYDWIIAKDVLEHIKINNLTPLLKQLSEHTDKMFVIVPLGINGNYYAGTNNLDPSHYICEPLSWWEDLFEKHGFDILRSHNNVDYMKEAYNHIHNAHGFLTLKTKSK